jgi:signal transduction histidine kinase
VLRRLPIESTEPLVSLALVRLGLTAASLVALVIMGFPYEGRLTAVLGGLALPWSVAVLLMTRRAPQAALSPMVAVGDVAVLVAAEIVAVETYAAVRFVALFLFAVHAHFQGERIGLAIALGGASALVVAGLLGDAPVGGDLLVFYETIFVIAATATAVLIGRLRTTESASRLRARELTRRTIEGENEVRRRVAESIHDGPVQELIALDMMLSAAGQAAERAEGERTKKLIGEARELAARNVQALRDEIVDLGPYAFEELSFETAVEGCVGMWRRRYGFEVLMTIESLDLSPEVANHLFRISQEAVVNAGRHAGASAVSLSLRSLDGYAELRVTDDGKGFGDVDPLGSGEPGHLGLASMRERAELLDGELEIESSDRGTKVMVRAPLRRRRGRRRH